MNEAAKVPKFFKKADNKNTRPNWLFEIEPYSRRNGESLSEIRDNMRLKKVLRNAVENDFAPVSLIDEIRARIRAW
jgi:hypothetical protein